MDKINKRYQEICSEMGHLQFNLEKITARMQDLRAEVASLDELVNKSKAAKAAAAEQEKAAKAVAEQVPQAPAAE
jgi:prefoldin subunit 5